MIGIIYTGESEEELMREWEMCQSSLGSLRNKGNFKIFVEPCMRGEFVHKMNILDTYLNKGLAGMYNGIKITNSKRESNEREKRNQTTLTMKQIADKFGVAVENLRIKD